VLDRPVDGAAMAGADRMGVGDEDRRGQRAGLLDPGDAGHLAVAVQRVEACGAGIADSLAATRQDRGDAGAHRALANPERPMALDQGDIADRDARHVGDRVVRTGAAAQRNAEAPGPRLAGWCLHAAFAHRVMSPACASRSMAVMLQPVATLA